MHEVVIATLYHFVDLDDAAGLRQQVIELCAAHEIKGTLLIAPEGINGTLAASRHGIDALLDALRADPRFANLRHQETYAAEPPFKRTKIRLKREIVTFGVKDANPNIRVGQYVHPLEWNALITDPEIIVIDTRNDYEFEIGTFEGAIDPKTENFGQFPAYVEENLDPAKHRKVAMFCTGGIRCEKATSYMLAQGFDEIYHLQGGILHYLDTVPEEESLWKGRCFVFDERRSVGHAKTPTQHESE